MTLPHENPLPAHIERHDNGQLSHYRCRPCRASFVLLDVAGVDDLQTWLRAHAHVSPQQRCAGCDREVETSHVVEVALSASLTLDVRLCPGCHALQTPAGAVRTLPGVLRWVAPVLHRAMRAVTPPTCPDCGGRGYTDEDVERGGTRINVKCPKCARPYAPTAPEPVDTTGALMTSSQIQRAARDTTGDSGWSPEVRWLAREVERLTKLLREHAVGLVGPQDTDVVVLSRAEYDRACADAAEVRTLREEVRRKLGVEEERAEAMRLLAKARDDLTSARTEVDGLKVQIRNLIEKNHEVFGTINSWMSRAYRAEADVVACQEVYTAARRVVQSQISGITSNMRCVEAECLSRLANAVGL